MAGTVKSIAADAIAGIQNVWQSVNICVFGHPAMESGVEDSDLGDLRTRRVVTEILAESVLEGGAW